MKIVTISSKGQITIPKEYLSALGLKAKSKAFIEKDSEKVTLKPIKGSVVEETAGSLTRYVHPSKLGKSIKEIDKETKRLYAKHLAKKHGLKR